MLTINLKDISKDDIALVGGKGANLGELIRSGFPVPPGFCITSYAYDLFIEHNGLAEGVDERSIIEAGKIPGELLEAIKQQHQLLGSSVRMAVRSSATAEDLPEASFAGQQETFLNIVGIESLITAVKKCFASLWTERAVSYRSQTGFDKIKVSLAVVVQEMIEGEVSGVLFTANPINHCTTEVVVNASYGLGEAIVSGKVTPDLFTWDTKTRTMLDKRLGSKEIAIVYGEQSDTVIKAVDETSRNQFCITDADIERLVEIGKNIEAHYGFPQDIEWAVKEQRIYILQTRGITTLNNREHANIRKPKKQQTRMERMIINNLVEHCPTPPWPLDFIPICAVLGGRATAMKEFGFCFSGSIITLLDDGVINFQIPRLKITPDIVFLPFRLSKLFQAEKNIQYTRTRFENVTTRLKQYEETELSSHANQFLQAAIKDMMSLAQEIIYIRFRYNILPNVLLNKRLKLKFSKKSMSFNEYDLLSGLEYRTWQMNQDLQRLAEQLKKDKNRETELLNAKTDMDQNNILELCMEQDKVFEALYLDIIETYGWKSRNSYQAFSTVSWNERRADFMVLFRSYLSNSKTLERGEKYEMICQQIKANYSQKETNNILNQIEQLRSYHQNREESLYILERCYGICRMYARELIGRYPRFFTSYDEALYLTLDELCTVNDNNITEMKAKAMVRKQNRNQNQQLWDSLELSVIQTDDQNLLQGVSGNVGKVKGQVCIITSTEQFDKISPGDILVCKYTDPIWTPLFHIAKAVVSDTGGPLSHSAIVAREFGIPAVLGCAVATKVLADGDEVIVDGDNGTVQKLGKC